MGSRLRARRGTSQPFGRVAKRERKTTRDPHHCLRSAEQAARSLRSVTAVPKRNLVLGAIVWAHIPFVEAKGEKLRPALVIGRSGDKVQLVPITSSKTRLRYPDYIEIKAWESAGLTRPCGARLREVEIELIEVVGLIGDLEPDEPLLWALTVYEVLAG